MTGPSGTTEAASPHRSLAGATAVVTGASSGIGRAVAIALARRGSTVHLVARRAGQLEEVAAEIGGAGGTAVAHPADLTDDRDQAALAMELSSLGISRLDVVVHAAGAFAHGAVADTAIDDLDALYRCNVRAPFRLTQALLPLLEAARGDVVFVNSTAGRSPRGSAGAYAATKAALWAFAEALRDEVNDAGVRVLTVFPGRTATPMQQRVHAAEGRPYNAALLLQPDDIASAIVAALELPATAEMTEIRIRPARKT
jgi:NADP-dependent 3-hydroxy acid dehydrogenase YdfG